MGANLLVVFKMFFLIGSIFLNLGHFIFKLGGMGANVLVEFENVFLIGGIFLSWGHRENHLFWGLYGPLIYLPTYLFVLGKSCKPFEFSKKCANMDCKISYEL